MELSPKNREKVRVAVEAACARLFDRERRLAARAGPPAPGDVYIIDETQWLVVRAHPDDEQLLLVVPIDDFPLVGSADVALDEPDVARCGESTFLQASRCELRVDVFTGEVLTRVRAAMAGLARGRPPGYRPEVDFDPEYEEWMAEVEQAREKLG